VTEKATSAADDSNRLQIKYPTTTTTPESITLDNGYSGNADSGQVDQAPITANGEQSYSFYAVTDVDLLIVVDQVVVWQQPLLAGQATGYLTGSSFVVSISGADSITVLDASGNSTEMTAPEFTLP
jgi:hypothetical protein